ncbi:MAG: hypothetical protein ACLP7Q_05200 [Isosphaeraceae bacterium]
MLVEDDDPPAGGVETCTETFVPWPEPVVLVDDDDPPAGGVETCTETFVLDEDDNPPWGVEETCTVGTTEISSGYWLSEGDTGELTWDPPEERSMRLSRTSTARTGQFLDREAPRGRRGPCAAGPEASRLSTARPTFGLQIPGADPL